MGDGFFYIALGGAILILLYGGIRIIRKYPRIAQPRGRDEHLYTVARRAWETGRPIVGTVDDDGNLTMREVEGWAGEEIERERIRRSEVCSDKSHWRG